MFRRLRILATVAVATLLVVTLTACGDEEVSLDPPEIAYGEDISEMGMFVVDPRFTVAALQENDEWLLFDDIGELLKYHDRHPDTAFQVTWVNDYHSEEWLKAEDATYVQSAAFTSPMGWMVAAFADEDEAHTLHLEHGGEMMTWDEAMEREWTDPPAPDHDIHNDHATPDAGHDQHDTTATPDEHDGH